MLRLSIRSKVFSALLAVALSLTTYPPVSLAAASDKPIANAEASAATDTAAEATRSPSYSDVPKGAWYAEAVNEWIARGILSPQPGDEFKPDFVTTRGDFAFLLAYSLGLVPSGKAAAFKDLPEGDVAGYITSLKEAGLVRGFPDGTFRPDEPVTRAEAASWIVAAKKLKPQSGSLFADVKAKSWYSGAVNALASTGIILGKTKNRFAPNDVILRAETINLLYRSFYKASTVQDIREDGTVLIDGVAYRAGDSVKGIFRSSNKPVLRNAAIQFVHNGKTIVSVENLIIGYRDSLAGSREPLVFDARGNAIVGKVTVNADQVTVANLEVKGDLILTPAFQRKFFAYDVLVKGKTVYLEDADRPQTQIAELEFQRSDLGKLFLLNSMKLKEVRVVAEQVSKSGANPKTEVRALANSDLICPSCGVVPYALVPGLFYIQVTDGAIQMMNSGGLQNYQAGQFGYTPHNFNTPPIVVPTNPGLPFTPPALPIPNPGAPSTPPTTTPLPIIPSPITTPTPKPSKDEGSTKDRDATQGSDIKKIICDNVNCEVDAYGKSQIDTGPTGTLGTVTVHSGAEVRYLGSNPIDTLILGDSNGSGDASFTGSADIGKVTLNGKSGGQIVLDVNGTIGTLQTTGAMKQIVLTGNVKIDNLVVPPGVDPKSLFANASDLSKVAAINGQLTTTPPIVTPPPSSTPSPSVKVPNGMSAPTTAEQKAGGTTIATVTIHDADAAAQGVDHYRVFVSLSGEATSSNPYQQVNGTGAIDIRLEQLTGGAIRPADGQAVRFTVIAYDAAGRASVPASNDKASAIWDKSGPSSVSMSVYFNDTNGRANVIGGTIQVTGINEESAGASRDAESIEVSVTQGENNVLFSDVRETGESSTLTFDVSSLDISDTANVTATPIDRYGNRGTAVSARIVDWVPVPVHSARSVTFTDEDPGTTIGGPIRWIGAEDETDIDWYDVYFLDQEGNKVGAALRNVDPCYSCSDEEYEFVLQNFTEIPEGATQIGIFSRNEGGENETPAKAQIVNLLGVQITKAVRGTGNYVNLEFTDSGATEGSLRAYKVYLSVGSDLGLETSPRPVFKGTTNEINLGNNELLINGANVYITLAAYNQGESDPISTTKATIVWTVVP